MASLFFLQVRELDLEVAAELPQDLPARAARRRRRLGVGDDGDARERALPFGERLEHRDALGAHRQPVRRVLDVAARDDRTVGALERRADLELRIGRVCELARAPRRGDEIDLAGTVAQPARTQSPIVPAAALASG